MPTTAGSAAAGGRSPAAGLSGRPGQRRVVQPRQPFCRPPTPPRNLRAGLNRRSHRILAADGRSCWCVPLLAPPAAGSNELTINVPLEAKPCVVGRCLCSSPCSTDNAARDVLPVPPVVPRLGRPGYRRTEELSQFRARCDDGPRGPGPLVSH